MRLRMFRKTSVLGERDSQERRQCPDKEHIMETHSQRHIHIPKTGTESRINMVASAFSTGQKVMESM